MHVKLRDNKDEGENFMVVFFQDTDGKYWIR